MGACGTPCLDQAAADICYAGYKVKPGMSADVRIGANTGATLKGTIGAGGSFGRQSVNNRPACAQHPGLRAARQDSSGNYWVFGYGLYAAGSGWIELSKTQPDASVVCCGPNKADFDCNVVPPTRCAGQRICDGDATSVSSRDGSARTVLANEVAIRIAPQSSALDYLAAGDLLEVWCYSAVADGYYCGRVIKSKWTPLDSWGWVAVNAF